MREPSPIKLKPQLINTGVCRRLVFTGDRPRLRVFVSGDLIYYFNSHGVLMTPKSIYDFRDPRLPFWIFRHYGHPVAVYDRARKRFVC